MQLRCHFHHDLFFKCLIKQGKSLCCLIFDNVGFSLAERSRQTIRNSFKICGKTALVFSVFTHLSTSKPFCNLVARTSAEKLLVRVFFLSLDVSRRSSYFAPSITVNLLTFKIALKPVCGWFYILQFLFYSIYYGIIAVTVLLKAVIDCSLIPRSVYTLWYCRYVSFISSVRVLSCFWYFIMYKSELYKSCSII
jgi:hypothetical protein